MKKYSEKNNKGFSLVELIVVVAIMAVLMAVLVPTLVRNVEKTRLQKDKSAISEIREAVVIAIADEAFVDAKESTAGANITSGTLTIADLFDKTADSDSVALAEEVETTCGGETIKITSKLKNSGNVKIAKLDTRNGQVVFQITSADHTFYIDSTGEQKGTFAAAAGGEAASGEAATE